MRQQVQPDRQMAAHVQHRVAPRPVARMAGFRGPCAVDHHRLDHPHQLLAPATQRAPRLVHPLAGVDRHVGKPAVRRRAAPRRAPTAGGIGHHQWIVPRQLHVALKPRRGGDLLGGEEPQPLQPPGGERIHVAPHHPDHHLAQLGGRPVARLVGRPVLHPVHQQRPTHVAARHALGSRRELGDAARAGDGG